MANPPSDPQAEMTRLATQIRAMYAELGAFSRKIRFTADISDRRRLERNYGKLQDEITRKEEKLEELLREQRKNW